jgi:sulfur relay (sulfurtransferase) DsrC/TusE family protein
VPILEYDGKQQVGVDEEGFLINFEEWNDDIAHMMAKREGVGTLQEDRLDILKFAGLLQEAQFLPDNPLCLQKCPSAEELHQ